VIVEPVVLDHGSGERFSFVNPDERHGATCESSTSHASTEAAWRPEGHLDDVIERRGRDLEVVAKAGMALGHQSSQFSLVPAIHCVSGCQRSIVLGHHVTCSFSNQVVFDRRRLIECCVA
jgi:hypothetical protein